jgi:guanine deaminase
MVHRYGADIIGQRSLVGKCCMDRHSPPGCIETTESSLEATKSFISYFDTLAPPPTGQPPLVQPIITPRFALSCTGPLLHSLGKLAASRTPSIAIQTHLSENSKEIESTLKEFPDCKLYTEVYDKAGLVGEGTILAHCVHLEQKEMEILRERKAGVSHCPVSNMNLNSGVAEVRKLLDMKIKVSSVCE